MTRRLSKEEKKKRKEDRQAKAKGQQMQKAPSTTAQNVQVPKAEGAEPPPDVNLCDNCAYEFGECEGNPSFADDESNDRVVKCPAFADVDNFPNVQDQAKKDEDNAAAPGPAAAEEKPKHGPRKCDVEHLRDYPECFEECEKDKCNGVPIEPEELHTIDKKFIPNVPDRPALDRFEKDTTDYGKCTSCDWELKRTAWNRYRDAIRCVNPRCNLYREIVKSVSTGVK